MATYYIATTGDDTTGNGSFGNPWATIGKFNSVYASTDTLIIMPGTTYSFGSGNLTWTLAATIQSYNSDPTTTIITGGGNVRRWDTSVALTIENLGFTAVKSAASVCIFQNAAPASAHTFTNCIFDTLTIEGASSSLFGNFLNAVSTNYGTVTANSCLFRNINANGGAGDAIIGAGKTQLAFVLYGNTFYTDVAAADTLPILSWNTYTGGVAFSIDMRNNIIFNANGTNKAWYLNQDATSYTGSTNNLIRGYSSVPTLTNTLTSDPLFVDAAGGNFNLRPSSPAIGAGVVI